jgi:hypothetical protein
VAQTGWFADPLPHDRRGVSGSDGDWRITFTGFEGEAPIASLFLLDSRRTERAQWQFRLEPDQRLPRIPFGGVVRAHGFVARGERPTLTADGVTIRPASDLEPGVTTLLAGGNAIVHPAVAGIHPDRHYTQTHSFDSVGTWEGYVARRIRNAALWLTFCTAALLVPLAYLSGLLVRAESAPPASVGTGVGHFLVAVPLAAIALAGTVRVRRALVAALALRETVAEPMYMDLWWSAGHEHGSGPVAIASLGWREDDCDLLRVPVIGVTPELFAIDHVVPVLVRGRRTGSPLVEVRGRYLWPADRARYHADDGWRPITGPRGRHPSTAAPAGYT